MSLVRLSPRSIYDYLPYLDDHIADVRKNGQISSKHREAMDNHEASVIVDFFDFAQDIPEMSPEHTLKFAEIVCRNFERGWVTKFDTETGLDYIVST